MSRTLDEIYETIIREKTNMAILRRELTNEDGTTSLSTKQDLLNNLTTDNHVAIWKLWVYVISCALWLHESIWDVFKVDVSSIIEKGFVATTKWIIKKALAFQYGDNLSLDNINYTINYETIDVSKQIIASANASEGGGRVFLKIRRKDTDILSNDEMNSFSSYINNIKVAGQRIAILNYPADELKLYYTIYYKGEYPISTIKAAVENTIQQYIENIEFDSILNVTKLTDSIQTIEGIDGVEFNSTLSGGRAYNAPVWVNIYNYYNSAAGWNKIAIGYPLEDTITYISK